MKYLIVICLFLAFGCNNAGTKKSSNEVKLAVQENVKTVAVELSIQGMTCLGCEQTIQSGIAGIKGVKQVKATFKNGKAFVEFIPEMADTMQMKEKITASGYIVVGIKSIPLDTLRSKL
ncbi:MAG: cation transporter [Bacteroidia bacterium]|nr:cation transporter [Bacteroidia bacterium]